MKVNRTERAILEILAHQPGRFTIDDLVVGVGESQQGALREPASRIRKAMGRLYGAGFVRVVELRHETVQDEVWALTTPDDRQYR